MARKKNLERAIILGLILSTGVYGSAWAAEVGPIHNATYNNDDNAGNPFSESVIVNANTDGEKDSIGNIVLRDENNYNVIISTNNGNIEFKENSGSGILLADGIKTGTTVTINASGEISINAGYGIQGNAKDREDGNVSKISLTAKNNKITTSNIGIYSTGGVDVLLNAESNEIISDGKYGIQATESSDGYLTLTATNGNNTVKAENGTAIRANGEKVITLDASGNNIVIGGIYGIENTETNQFIKTHNKIYTDLDAVNNIIYGTDTAIKSDGLGITDIKADQNNNIGFLTNDKGEITDIAQTGINVTEGTVNVNAGNTNTITASNIGISATGGSVFVGGNAADKLSNASTTITVTSDEDAYGVYGYEIGEGGKPININADVDVVSDKVEISVTGKNSSGSPTVAGVYFVNNAGETNIKAGNSGLTITVNSSLLNGGRGSVYGIHTQNTANSTFASSGDVNITSVSNELGNATGIYSANSIYDTTDNVINVSGKNVNVSATTVSGSAFGIQTSYQDSAANGFKNKVVVNADENVYITANNTSETGEGNSNGINVGGGDIEITAKSGSTVIKSLSDINNEDIGGSGIYVGSYGSAPYSSNAVVKSNLNNEIYAGNAVYTLGEKSIAKITSQTANNKFTTSAAGVVAYQGSNVELYAKKGENIIDADATGIIAADYYGIGENSKVNLVAKKNQITSVGYGIRAAAKGDVDLNATVADNVISVKDAPKDDSNEIITSAIFADTVSDVDLVADASNNIYANQTTITNKETGETGDYGTAYAVNALSGSSVDLAAGEQNYLLGAVYANGTGTNVDVKGKDGSTATNVVRSYTEIAGAGDIDTTSKVIDGEETNKFKDKRFVSAVYAEDGANIALTGENSIGTWADSKDANTLERTVWAYSSDETIGSSINFDGAVQIGTDSYSVSPNSADVAIAAGTATDLTKEDVDGFINDPDAKRSIVTIEYDDFKDAEGNYAGSSYISGDILSAYAGQVDINAKENTNAGITIEGNLLAGNNGILNVDLGNGGYLAGRIDDYQDAGTNNTDAADGHLKFYDPAFSSTIYGTGTVNLDMGTNSYWRVTGQSWVTSISGENATIDMRNSNNADTNSHAVHVGTLTGNHTFVMDLNDANHNISDMLYIKDEAKSRGIQTVYLNTVAGLENMQDGDKLRFATVNAGTEQLSFIGEYNGENGYSPARSRVMLYDTGFNNAAFEIGNETYSEADTENSGYNGESFNETKPGDAYVDAEYGDGATNWYITRNSSGDEISDAGKTMLNMSRANYSNAIYMDRLNKRLGEARYINSEEDEGMWIRIRHDRIGKDDAYRSQNTMYELGYDQKQECDNGERRVGMAIDYMHGDTGYNDIAGKGEIDRYGLWLYDTWMGDKGHYADYVAKWGHLSNDFEIYNSRGEVTGDYSNNVFSVSAEYGRKKDIGNDWYFEPQVQAQLARVTGADYTTSQGTKVSVDGINSLIGRAGFRLGKDFGEEKQSTVYIKADVLHEFLGDQDIRALDSTTNGNWQTVSYENEGTWYDVGFGFATQMSKNSYAFMDFEKSFGNDNDETYQINVGMQWSF